MLSKSAEHNDAVSKIIKFFRKKKGVFITLNKPHQLIDSKNLFFIDGASDKKPSCANSCIHLTGPQALTELSVALSQLINFKKFDFIILDSLFTMLTYNEPSMVERFIHYFVSKMRELGVIVVIASVRDAKSSSTHNNICQLADKCLL